MSSKLNLQDLIDLLTSKEIVSKEEAEAFLGELFNLIEQGLTKDELAKIKDFGTFKLTPIQARESIDVNTQEKIVIPAHRRVSFLPAQTLKNIVNKPFAHFETTLLNDGITLKNMEQDAPSDQIDSEESQDFPEESDLSIEEKIDSSITPLVSESEDGLENETIGLGTSDTSKTVHTDLTNIEPAASDNKSESDFIIEKANSKQFLPPLIKTPKKSKINEKPKRSFLWLYISIALFMIAAVIGSYYFFNGKNSMIKQGIEESEIPKTIQETTPILQDTISTPLPALPAEPLETVILSRGKTLRLIALDKFGSREFWVYIYLANKDKIKNPDVVPLDVELVLPRKTEYDIDPENPESVAKAKKLGDEEMKKFW